MFICPKCGDETDEKHDCLISDSEEDEETGKSPSEMTVSELQDFFEGKHWDCSHIDYMVNERAKHFSKNRAKKKSKLLLHFYRQFAERGPYELHYLNQIRKGNKADALPTDSSSKPPQFNEMTESQLLEFCDRLGISTKNIPPQIKPLRTLLGGFHSSTYPFDIEKFECAKGKSREGFDELRAVALEMHEAHIYGVGSHRTSIKKILEGESYKKGGYISVLGNSTPGRASLINLLLDKEVLPINNTLSFCMISGCEDMKSAQIKAMNEGEAADKSLNYEDVEDCQRIIGSFADESKSPLIAEVKWPSKLLNAGVHLLNAPSVSTGEELSAFERIFDLDEERSSFIFIMDAQNTCKLPPIRGRRLVFIIVIHLDNLKIEKLNDIKRNIKDVLPEFSFETNFATINLAAALNARRWNLCSPEYTQLVSKLNSFFEQIFTNSLLRHWNKLYEHLTEGRVIKKEYLQVKDNLDEISEKCNEARIHFLNETTPQVCTALMQIFLKSNMDTILVMAFRNFDKIERINFHKSEADTFMEVLKDTMKSEVVLRMRKLSDDPKGALAESAFGATEALRTAFKEECAKISYSTRQFWKKEMKDGRRMFVPSLSFVDVIGLSLPIALLVNVPVSLLVHWKEKQLLKRFNKMRNDLEVQYSSILENSQIVEIFGQDNFSSIMQPTLSIFDELENDITSAVSILECNYPTDKYEPTEAVKSKMESVKQKLQCFPQEYLASHKHDPAEHSPDLAEHKHELSNSQISPGKVDYHTEAPGNNLTPTNSTNRGETPLNLVDGEEKSFGPFTKDDYHTQAPGGGTNVNSLDLSVLPADNLPAEPETPVGNVVKCAANESPNTRNSPLKSIVKVGTPTIFDEQNFLESKEADRAEKTTVFIKQDSLLDVRYLSEGNFSYSFLAKYEASEVVIKAPKSKAGRDELFEFQILDNLPHHPNVLSIIGICTMFKHERLEENTLAVITPFQSVGSLKEFLQTKVELSEMDLQNLALGMARGLCVAHKHNIVHRDVAARNYLLSGDYRVLLSDFGLSRRLKTPDEHVSNANSTKGPYYSFKRSVLPWRWCAPETLGDQISSLKSDVWMFGVAVWQLCTRAQHDPFQDIVNSTKLYTAIKYEKVCLEIQNEHLEKLAPIIRNCCQAESSRRYSMMEVVEILQKSL